MADRVAISSGGKLKAQDDGQCIIVSSACFVAGNGSHAQRAAFFRPDHCVALGDANLRIVK